ncbi:hypothetical protein [Luteimonas granuli]|uniref:Uncharacterized protein n=1 Tax=Luteimonas granuli TaxID=1176533 RepID=A0A518N165_9GAMM|nr:hypothetical protein [Luteimonas granuli]QDW65655.1 hypothetical protein FPZ22_01020 [Luteimonas granuli]
MKILAEGKGAFLEFLRNLTPQVLLFVFALTAWVKLDFTTIDLSNWATTLAFYVCAITLALAVIANMTQFIENYSSVALKPISDRIAKVKAITDDRGKRQKFLRKCIARYKWSVALHVTMTLLVVEAAVIAAAWIGARQAIQLLRVAG